MNFNINSFYRNGYIFLPEWMPEKTTLSIASSIGSVIDMQKYLKEIPRIQTLIPRDKNIKKYKNYSGTFGLNEFPLHTDLAHWEIPPRYMLLRCISGSDLVQTKLLDSSKFLPELSPNVLLHAVVCERRPTEKNDISLLPVIFDINGIKGIRWDFLFLVPMNEEATLISDYIKSQVLNHINSYSLANLGDTLIIDNWRVLHGRGTVYHSEKNRKIERIYLSGIKL